MSFSKDAEIISMEGGNCWYSIGLEQEIKLALFPNSEIQTVKPRQLLEQIINQNDQYYSANIYFQCQALDHIFYIGVQTKSDPFVEKCIMGKFMNNRFVVTGEYSSPMFDLEHSCVPASYKKLFIRWENSNNSCLLNLENGPMFSRINQKANYWELFINESYYFNMDMIIKNILNDSACSQTIDIDDIFFDWIVSNSGETHLFYVFEN